MTDLTLWIVLIAFLCLAGVIVVLSLRYSGSSVSLYDYVKRVYPKEYEDLLRKDGKVLTIVGAGGGSMVPTELGLSKSRFGYQFKALEQIAQINPNDQELRRQVTNMASTLKVALGLLYGVLGGILLIFAVKYVSVTM